MCDSQSDLGGVEHNAARLLKASVLRTLSPHRHFLLGDCPDDCRYRSGAIRPGFDVAKVEEVVMKALAKEPLQRFESVQAFADALTWAAE